MKKKQLGMILIVIIILISVISFVKFIETDSENGETQPESENEEIQYIFEMNVDTNETNNYTIITPIAKGWDGTMFSIDDYKTVKGNASLNYTDTQYGRGLKIEANGSFSIKAKKNKNTKLVGFTMANKSVNFTDKNQAGEKIGYWFSLENVDNTSVDISIHCWEKDLTINFPYFDINGSLKESNWMLINGEYNMTLKG